jgi:hypothetical protein
MGKQTAEIDVKVTGDGKAKSKLGSLGNFIKKRLVISLSDLARIGKAVINVFKGMSAAASVQEDAITKLNQSLKNTGNFSVEASKDLQKYASGMQKITKFGDEEILNAMSLIAAFDIEGKELEDLTTATLDLAQAKGFNLVSAADLVAKSVGSSTNAMTRYGVEVTGAVGSTERANTAVTNMAKIFGGQAMAAAKTFSGQQKTLADNLGDVAEQMGFMIQERSKGFIGFMNRAAAATAGWIKETRTSDKAFSLSQKTRQENGENLKKLTEEELILVSERMKQARDMVQLSIKEDKLSKKKLESREKVKAQYDELIIKTEKYITAIEKERQKKFDADKQDRKNAADKKKREDDLIQLNKDKITDAQETSDLLATIAEDGGAAIGQALKDRLSAEIDLWMAAEIAKATAAAPLTLGASLGAIPLITAAGTAGKAAINAVQFEQGGQFERPNTSTTTSGQTAVDNEAGLERVTVEPIGQPESNSGGGGALVVQINLDGKQLAKQLYPQIKAIERSIS